MNKLKKYLQDRINLFRDSVAIKTQGNILTYNELDVAATLLAVILGADNIKSNIGIYGKRDLFTYKAVLAVIYANKTYVPLNEKNHIQKLQDIALDANINTILSTKDNIDFIRANFPNVKFILIIDETIELVKLGKNAYLSGHVGNESHLAYILFTSGSTGAPKGVMVTKENVLSYIQTKMALYLFESKLNFSQTAHISFDISTFEIFICFSSGGILHISTDNDLLCPSEYIQRNNINVWYSVPTFATIMSKLQVLEQGCFPSLKYSFFCGEPMPQNLAKQWIESAKFSLFENLYGPTEATVDVTRFVFKISNSEVEYYRGILPLGNAIPNQKLILVDDQGETIDENDTIGEILISGSQVCSGYLNNTEKNKETFYADANGTIWYRTGDLALYIDGNLNYHSRKDTQIKIGGKRVEIEEIEHTFKSKDLIQDIIIVAKRDTNGIVSHLVAFTLEKVDNRQFLKIQHTAAKYIDKLFIPKYIFNIKEYPKTMSGKIDRRALEEILKV